MKNTLTYNGIEYALGSGGSLLLSCPICGRDRFREAHFYFTRPDPESERCFDHPDTPLEPVKESEIESRWRPLWNKA